MTLTVRIRLHERGLRFRHGDVRAVLGPGTYRLWSRLWSRRRDRIEVLDTTQVRIQHDALAALLESPVFRAAVLPVA